MASETSFIQPDLLGPPYEELTPAMIEADALASLERQAAQSRRIAEHEANRKKLMQDDYPYPVDVLRFDADGVEIPTPTMAEFLERQAARHQAVEAWERAVAEGREVPRQLRLDDLLPPG